MQKMMNRPAATSQSCPPLQPLVDKTRMPLKPGTRVRRRFETELLGTYGSLLFDLPLLNSVDPCGRNCDLLAMKNYVTIVKNLLGSSLY